MLHPSYNELMDYVNENAAPQENGEPLVQSRYTLVMAAAKRARQIVEARSKVQASFTAADKPLSVAVKELYSGEVRILGENEEPDAVAPEVPEEESARDSADSDAKTDTETEEADPEMAEEFAETGKEEGAFQEEFAETETEEAAGQESFTEAEQDNASFEEDASEA